ncbi:MAG TPA: hypothetical protein VN844_10355 [Pyrinomonadaceae bacterium]|nr:hypothetical protein [Pyrinomonadaceae bacterium]
MVLQTPDLFRNRLVLCDQGSCGNFSGTDRTTITKALEADKLDVDQVIEDFSYNYLEVIEKNMTAKYAVGEQLANCVRYSLSPNNQIFNQETKEPA